MTNHLYRRLKAISAAHLFLLSVLFLGGTNSFAQTNERKPPESGELYNLSASSDLTKIKANNTTVTLEEKNGAQNIKVLLPANQDYPGIDFPCPTGGWDLTGYNGVELAVTNTGDAKIGVALRIDNSGDWQTAPWNTELKYLNPGETKTIRVSIGFSYGEAGFALDPAHVVNIKVFANKVTVDTAILIRNLKAFKS